MPLPTPSAVPEWGTPGHPDQVIFQTDLVKVGAFRCDVDHPVFRNSDPVRQPCFVFPRTAVEIEHEPWPAFIADPTVVTMYNARQAYERRPISAEGDRCDWYGVTPGLLREAVRPFDPEAADDSDRLLRRPFARSRPALYLAQRRLFNALERVPAPEGLAVEESVCALLRQVLASAYGVHPTHTGGGSTAAARRRADLANAARRVLARRFREPLSLGAIAASIGSSPFHLSRTFHEATGLTLHRHRAELRLRAALELIAARVPLTAVALEVGYSSHSHFTEAFRLAYGVPPSRAAVSRIRAAGAGSASTARNR